MNIAHRDLEINNISNLVQSQMNILAEHFADMKQQAIHNHFLKEIIHDYSNGLQESIDGMKQQQKALARLMTYLDQIRNKSCGSDNNWVIKNETHRIIQEIKNLDNKITSLTNQII